MRVGVTGGSGRVGKLLVAHLLRNHGVVIFGRQNSDIEWALGVRPSPNQLSQVDVLIHLGWSLQERNADFHLNVGGTAILASAARDFGIPFLFVSSVAASSKSSYGLAKLKAEDAVAKEKGFNLRIGLIPEANRYASNSKKFFGIYPQIPCLINITNIDDFEDFIEKWLQAHYRESLPAKPVTLVSSAVTPREVLSRARISIPLPLFLIKGALFVSSFVSLGARNLQDSLLSVTTTPWEQK
jgi:hypothetical protein